ncbi:hypothetical protein [Nocardia rhizosphaerae]|uniref:Uncharacterized protein n=1 Tax=Nocardia rhizosphaerae TaxID=1691571 RepID=A0ABV8L240_9NOCA
MSAWITCNACQGDEGEIVDGEWVDCRCCQGEGGHPADETWSCRCAPAKEVD